MPLSQNTKIPLDAPRCLVLRAAGAFSAGRGRGVPNPSFLPRPGGESSLARDPGPPLPWGSSGTGVQGDSSSFDKSAFVGEESRTAPASLALGRVPGDAVNQQPQGWPLLRQSTRGWEEMCSSILFVSVPV